MAFWTQQHRGARSVERPTGPSGRLLWALLAVAALGASALPAAAAQDSSAAARTASDAGVEEPLTGPGGWWDGTGALAAAALSVADQGR